MDNGLIALLLFDALLFLVLIGLLTYHIRHLRKDRKKTEQILIDLDSERQKTNKFKVSLEEIQRMTKG